jgi:hypothetical protein
MRTYCALVRPPTGATDRSSWLRSHGFGLWRSDWLGGHDLSVTLEAASHAEALGIFQAAVLPDGEVMSVVVPLPIGAESGAHDASPTPVPYRAE